MDLAWTCLGGMQALLLAPLELVLRRLALYQLGCPLVTVVRLAASVTARIVCTS